MLQLKKFLDNYFFSKGFNFLSNSHLAPKKENFSRSQSMIKFNFLISFFLHFYIAEKFLTMVDKYSFNKRKKSKERLFETEVGED